MRRKTRGEAVRKVVNVTDLPTVTAIAPWFGSDRMVADQYAAALKGCRWVGIPFGGGMSIVPRLDARSIVVGDVHKHVINLALCIKCDKRRAKLLRLLRNTPFHPDAFKAGQIGCKSLENEKRWSKTYLMSGDVDWAYDYFVSQWMGRSGNAGTFHEFTGNASTRWNANGGDSNTRYRSAVASLAAWRRSFQRCNFVVRDCFAFLEKCGDESEHGLYVDPPFYGPGDRYKHRFTEADHRKLASVLTGFTSARVVCRFYDHPLVREIYPEHWWTWSPIDGGRKQSNAAVREFMLANRRQRELV